ncbi:pentapeptide repeat-containing protein [Kitasatospora sp. NPDC048722]|uniref:pentapeptide repeat-containing protein n=1 Tax=Kitasatospora sp. NPDC048722 TaxID=3155639 RepID=UPI00340301DB
MASDNRDKWYPKTLPLNQKAAARLGAWVTASADEALQATELDLRGANLSGGDFSEAWLNGAVLADVTLARTSLRRAHLESADLSGADLSDAVLFKAALDGASLRSAHLDRSNLTAASLDDVDARSATFRGAEFLDTSMLTTDLRGADLSDARMVETSFKVRLDEQTVVRGLSGTLFGPVTLVTEGTEQELDGIALQRWLDEHGAEAEVLSGFTYYAKLRTGFSRENPSGIVRRSSVDGIDYDEAFTRNLRWEPTEYLRLYELGHNEIDHVEITRAEAEAFVARITEALGTPSQES